MMSSAVCSTTRRIVVLALFTLLLVHLAPTSSALELSPILTVNTTLGK